MAALCHVHTYKHDNVPYLPSFHPLERSQHTILPSHPGLAVYKPYFTFRYPQIMLDATGSTNGPGLQLAGRTGAAQQQPRSHLGKRQSRLDPPQSTCVTAATESKITLQNCHLQIAATFLFMPGKEKCTLHPTKLLLGNGNNPEALLKDDQTILPVRSSKGTKAYDPN